MCKMLRFLLFAICSGMLFFSPVSFANQAPVHANKHTVVAQWYGDGVRCKRVGGFWRNGYWHAPRRVCWGGGGPRCRWVPGFWRHGAWYPGHRVCWGGGGWDRGW